MLRSARRPIVFAQATHARFAAAIAAVWGNDRFPRPPVPFEPFVCGVAQHDRGYGELDTDDIDDVTPERWIEIQRRGFARRGDDPVIDLIVALHVHRLLAHSDDPDRAAVAEELAASLPALRAAAGITEPEAAAADRITNLCDHIAFDFCFEKPAAGAVTVVASPAGKATEIEYTMDGQGTVTLAPWPLGVPRLAGVIAGFEADRYPSRLDPVIVVFRLQPA